MLSASGYSAGAIAKYRDLKRNPDLDFACRRATHKTFELEPLAITKIPRDYVHGRETGLRTWYRLDKQSWEQASQAGLIVIDSGKLTTRISVYEDTSQK